MQDQHPCMFVEYAPWAGVLISTNSTYPHGISRSRIFDRGAGGIVVSFSPEEVMRRCGTLDLRNGMLRVQLQLFAVPKDGSKVRNEVKFSICEDTENPRTLYNFSPVVFNIDKIAKSRSSGLSLSYDYYNFFFSASLMYNYDHLVLVDGATLFKITSLSATEKENRKGKKRGSHFATQSTHYHSDSSNHYQSPSSTPQAQVSQFLIHPQPPPSQPQPIVQPQSHSTSTNASAHPPSQPQPIVQPPSRSSQASVSSSQSSSSHSLLSHHSSSQSSGRQDLSQSIHRISSSPYSYRASFPSYSSHGPSHSSHSSHSSSHPSPWKYSNSRNPNPMRIAYVTPTSIPLSSSSHAEATIHVIGTGFSYCNCVYIKVDDQLTIARFFTNVDGEEMIINFYHPAEPQIVTIFLCAEDIIGTEFTVEFVGSRIDGRTSPYGSRAIEHYNGRHSPPLTPPRSPSQSMRISSAHSIPVPYVPSQTLRRLTKSHPPLSESNQLITLPDRRRGRDSPTDLASPPSKSSRLSPPPTNAPPSSTAPSSMRSPSSASTNYHSLINRFISFLPNSTRSDLTSSNDPLSPTTNHEAVTSTLVPLYAALKINASTARADHFLTYLSATCLHELILVNKEVYKFVSAYVSTNYYFYSDLGPWHYFTPKRLLSVNALTTLTSSTTSLTHIHFSDSFNSRLENSLPSTLFHLSFGEEFNQPLETLPASLLYLSLGYCFNQPLSDLPANLQFLSFGGYFNHPLRTLPRTLAYLKFGFAYNHPITEFPASLQYLALGTNFAQPITSVPTSLVFLQVSPDYQLPLDNVPLAVLKYSRRVTRGEINVHAAPRLVKQFFRELGVGEYTIDYISPTQIVLERPGKLTAVMIVGTGVTQNTKAYVQMHDQSYQVNLSCTRDFESPEHVLASVYLYHPLEPQPATVFFWESESYIRQVAFKVEFVRDSDYPVSGYNGNGSTQASNTSFFVSPTRKSNSFSVTSPLYTHPN